MTPKDSMDGGRSLVGRTSEPHPFHDEWAAQRKVSKPYPGNSVAGEPIAPDQPCFDCGQEFRFHPAPDPLAALREAVEFDTTPALLVEFEKAVRADERALAAREPGDMERRLSDCDDALRTVEEAYAERLAARAAKP